MLKKLRIKFICMMMAVVTLMMCLMMGLVISFTSRDMEKECQSALQKAAVDPGFMTGKDNDSILPYLTMYRDRFGKLQVRGTIYLDQFTEEDLLQIWSRIDQTREGELSDLQLRYRCYAAPFGLKYVLVDVSSHHRIMEGLVRICVVVGLMGQLVFFALSVFLARWAVRPVERAWAQQRQFVADASHELKTPLTVILTNAELLRSGEEDPAAAQRSISSIQTMSAQMRILVEGLLELARLDNGSVRTGFAPLDFSGLVNDSLLIFEASFYEAGLEIISNVEDGIQLKGSEGHLRQVVDILLDNALKYSLPGTVRMDLHRSGNCCHLTLANSSEEISREDTKKIFQRFYRVDKSRTGNGSYGLGLSIAHQIVTEHRGKIWAEYSNGEVCFHIQLPM